MLMPPAALVVSTWIDKAFLVLGIVLLVFPLARVVFGGMSEGDPPDWDEGVAMALERLPAVYAVVLVFSLSTLLMHLARTDVSPVAALGWALSLWITLMFGNCAAHELLHRPLLAERTIGHMLAGLGGYPLLGYEHHRHHRMPGNTAAAEWPTASESVWRFAARRLAAIMRESIAPRGLLMCGNARSPTVRGLRIAFATTLATWMFFGIAAGWHGLLLYLGVVVLVGFAMQLVTYMQHWGLGDDSVVDAKAGEYGWEGDCRFQVWLTMGLSLHHAHHRNGSLPYYRIGLDPASARLPAGYVLLMFAAFVPPLWRRVMRPALEHWRSRPTAPLSSGRRITCVALYR